MMYAEAGRKKQNVNRQQTRAAETSMAEKVFRDLYPEATTTAAVLTAL